MQLKRIATETVNLNPEEITQLITDIKDELLNINKSTFELSSSYQVLKILNNLLINYDDIPKSDIYILAKFWNYITLDFLNRAYNTESDVAHLRDIVESYNKLLGRLSNQLISLNK